MADQNENSDRIFTFLLHIFSQNIDISRSWQLDLNFKYNTFVSLSAENTLILDSIVTESVHEATDIVGIEKICGFALNDNSQRAVLQVAVCSACGEISICEVQDAQLHCLQRFTIQNLLNKGKTGAGEDFKCQLVQYKGDCLTVCVNKNQLVSFSVKEIQYKLLSTISLSVADVTPRFEIIDDICIEADWGSAILFSSLRTGELVSKLDIEKLNISPSSVQTWCLSEDFRFAVLILQSGDIQLVHLQRFCETESLRKQTSFHGSGCATSWYETSQYGDIPWRERLVCLHSRQDGQNVSQKSSKVPKAFTSHGARGFPKRAAKMSGFMSPAKTKKCDGKFVEHIVAPEGVQGFSAEDLCVDQGHISVLYAYNDKYKLCFWNMHTHCWKTHRLREGEKIILSKISSLPHLIVSDTRIQGILTKENVGQEQLVSELMVYGGAILADTVCHLNNWGRSSMPVHTLQMGLKHRQQDTVAFFLKSKEKLFSSTHSTNVQYRHELSSPSAAPQFSHLDTISQLEPAVSLIIKAVRDTVGDKHAQLFGQQVLDILMDFLYELMLDGLSLTEAGTSEPEKKDILKATEKLLGYIESGRSCVRALEEAGSVSRSESVSTGSVSGLSSSLGITQPPTPVSTDVPESPILGHVSEWDRMDIGTVIEDGIMKNAIPELQQYLLQREEYSRADYSQLKTAGISLAINYIKYGIMSKAKELLQKLGLNVSDELWNIALFTQDASLCNSIIEELLSTSSLTGEQVSMVTFYRELCELYPCRNFDGIQQKYPHVKDSESHEVQRLRSLINQSTRYDLTANCGSLSQTDTDVSAEEVESPGGGLKYNEVLLAWVKDWNVETRELIKLDVLLHKSGSDLGMFNKKVIWGYLLSRNMADVLVAWIHNSFHGNHAAKEDVQWPVTHLGSVPSDFVNHVGHCSTRTRNRVIEAFARNGIFTEEALSSFETLLKLVNQIGGPLQLPHPLQHCDPDILKQFHCDMVHHCVQHNLPYFLWTYVTFHKLEGEFLLGVLESSEDRPWLPLFLRFISVAVNNQMRQSMYEASLMNAVMVWGSERSCVGELLQRGHPLAALATLMYSHHQLHQVTFVTQQLEAFDGLSSELVEKAVQDFPKLQVTLFPARSSDVPHADVSVYQLLVGNAPFDPAKLFGWQSTNTCAGEDCMQELPFFSHAALVARHGYSEQLKYTYYLKQGRPSFAFVTFLADEFKNGSHTLSSKRLAIAIGTSLWIGVKHFPDPQISSSCVVFQELLGHDSLLLRTYIRVGAEILAHRNNAVTGPMDRRREQTKKNEQDVVELLLDCIQKGRQFAPTVLTALEAAILAAVTRDRLCSFDASQKWTVAIVFCQLLNLPYSTVFLESCAEAKQWLPFIWFSQIHQYPKEQLLNLLHKFQSRHLQEHLRYVLTNAELRSSAIEEKKVQVKQRSERVAKDMRSSLYTRIGLVKADSEASSTDDEENHSGLMGSLEHSDSSQEDSVLEVTYDSSPDDVFGVIFAAQLSKCQWKSLLVHAISLRNCLFAELACCLEGASVLQCLCGWFVSMMDVTEHAQFLENHGKSPWRYNMHTLDAILDLFVRKKWGSLLVTGFDIFQQSSPLLPFLQFYAEFTEQHNFKNCRLLLDEFKESVFQFHHEKSVRAMECIGDSDWMEKTTYRIIQYMLTSTSSIHEVSQLLHILDSESITLVFKTVDPDFRRQSQLVTIIEETELNSVDFLALLGQNSEQFDKECVSIMDRLMERQMFSEARKFGTLPGINVDHVTVKQLYNEKEKLTGTDLWHTMEARLNFYRECSLKFNKHQIQAEAVADFFEKETAMVDNPREKAKMYELCRHCVKLRGGLGDQVMSDIYRKMWMCRIQYRVQTGQTEQEIHLPGELETASPGKEKKELMFCGKMPRTSDKPSDLDDKEVEAVKSLAGELLRNGRITECCRLLTEFNVYLQDLAVILTCIRLSMGTLTLDTMSTDMRHLLRSRPGETHRLSIASPVALLRNSSTISLMSNIQPVIDSVSIENESLISAMECLLNHCDDGRHLCIRVLTAFKIAAVLCIGYDDVITGDDYYILRSLLKTTSSAKFRLAADFLGTSSLSSEQVAGFLSDSILQSCKVSLGEEVADKDVFFDPMENFADFHQIVRLCQEPSLLGNRLIDCVVSVSDDPEQTSAKGRLGPQSGKVLTLQTELLILAHECYTAACDMEGISNILRAARILTGHLEKAGEFSVMTRLLTGVSRYNEMVYIFDALKQNHQFELLLGKGMEKETKLKTAILDYLKRYHPTDTDTYTMVALNFLMYREIAQQLEDNANKILDKMSGKPLDSSPESLQKTVQFLSEAAESYIKDNCVRHAQACIRKARLVALQIKYLKTPKQFINLTSKGANLLIADHPVFSEAFIVSEAYKQKESWAAALCNNVINLGNMKYLTDFRTHVRITPQLVEEAVDRYQQSSEKSPQALTNIKKLLQFCKDVRVQYRIAKQLGLRDFIGTLDKGDAKSYILDFSKTSVQ